MGFPSSHDVFDSCVNDYISVAIKMMNAGYYVMMTTKPRLSVIKTVCQALWLYRKSFEFRFTIGSSNNAILKTWEPYAPDLSERLECIKYINGQYRVSISMEPLLDTKPLDLIQVIYPYVQEIWIGNMNHTHEIENLHQQFIKDNIYLTHEINSMDGKFFYGLISQIRSMGLNKIFFKESVRNAVINYCKKK